MKLPDRLVAPPPVGWARPTNGEIQNALTIDVEEWFHVSLFRHRISRNEWDSLDSTIVKNVGLTLQLLDTARVKATFYVLGWVAERYPDIVVEIKRRGHHIGSHGYSHEIVYLQTKDEFAADVERSLQVLNEVTGDGIVDYRAPSYSITEDSIWAYDVLSKLGIKYDSSIFPIKHDLYGIPHAPRFPFEIRLKCGTLLEFPLSTIRLFNSNIPISGGAYLRLYPLWFIKWAVRRLNKLGRPVVIYFHPWELDEVQPRQPVPLKTSIRHYTNIETMADRLRALLDEFQFAPVRDVLARVSPELSWPS